LSLLEVILAIAILGLSLAVIGQLVRLGSRNARFARDSATAQMLCESKLSEIAAGILPAESMNLAEFAESPDWYYSVQAEPAPQDGLISVRVTVQSDLDDTPNTIVFALTRWIVDPAAEYDTNSQAGSTSSGASGSGSSSGGASSSASGAGGPQ
jgi:type II secretory pathway pseudopilin PulG